MQVVWYQTTSDGQRKLGACIWVDGRLETDPDVKHFAADLLHGVDLTSESAVRAAFIKAPGVYDGAYIRAGYRGEAEEAQET